MTKRVVSHSVAETEDLAKEVLLGISEGAVISLYGDLGSGKTTFTSSLAKHIGVRANVQSPTFVLLREYEISHRGLKTLYHLDMYRLESYEHDQLGLRDLFEDKTALIVIEWADKIEHLLPKKRINIRFTNEGESARVIDVDDRRNEV